MGTVVFARTEACVRKLEEYGVFHYNTSMFKPVSPKVDFPKLEEEILKYWYEKGIVKKYLEKNKSSKKQFSFLDGPITANNPMGVHHAWGRTYKDIWRRFFNMRGYRQQFKNGFDCQGLWVEVEVEKELGIRNKKDIENLVAGDKKASIAKFVELCKERVRKFSAIQTEQSKRLGYFMDWDNSYYTMSDENNYWIWHFLKTCYEKGWIYKGRDSVPWCPRCETAISQHEMLTEDYKELTHDTVFVKLPIITKGWENTYLLVWTTTPWTVPANVAVGINTKYDYGIWNDRITGEKFIFLLYGEEQKPPTRIRQKDNAIVSLQQWVMDNTKRNIQPTGKIISIRELLNLKYKAPFDELERVRKSEQENPETFHSVIDASEVVSDIEGTGLLHVAPGAGQEDYKLGLKEHLSVISVIADNADYLDGLSEFSGKNAKKHPDIIISYLKEKDNSKYFLKSMRFTHRYPACWRCKTELVWRVTDEWYIAMDKKDKSGKTYREQMAEVTKKINWLPSWGLERELDWLKNMHDWLISKKNRYWGLALPVYECKKCGNFEVLGNKEELKKRAAEGWERFEGKSPHKPFIDEVKIKCNKCEEVVSRVDDVGNVWLDAGIVPFSTMPPDWFPADFITESFPGQFKNWFYSLIAMSTALKNTNSFKTVLGFASVRDEKGEEMHKSKGNAIEFNEAAQKIGADVMRWLYATQNPEVNLNFGYGPASDVKRRFYLILWNCYKFFIDYASLSNWDCKLKSGELSVLDKWILASLTKLVLLANKRLEKYDAAAASQAIENFIVKDFSTWYIRRSRERVSLSARKEDRNTGFAVIYGVLVTLTKLLAPFTPFIAEEIFKNLTGEESVHLQEYPKGDKSLLDKKLLSDMETVRKIVELGHAKRKELGIKVRQPLAEFSIFNFQFSINDELVDLIKDELNVKEVEFKEGKGELSVQFDTNITQELKDEGLAREIIRSIQEERKKLGTKLDEKVDVALDYWPTEFEEEIRRKSLVQNLKKGKGFKVTRIT